VAPPHRLLHQAPGRQPAACFSTSCTSCTSFSTSCTSFSTSFAGACSAMVMDGWGSTSGPGCRRYGVALVTALAFALSTTAAGLTVASVTPNPAPVGESVTLTINMEGVTEDDLFTGGGQNALRVSWPVSERGSQVSAADGWPRAGDAPADGKVAVTLTRSTVNRWPETGPIRLGTVRTAWLVSPSLGWITISDAGCLDVGGVDSCTIEFEPNTTRASTVAWSHNVTVVTNANNVANFQKVDPSGVKLLGVVSSLQACEDACYRSASAAGPECQSYTWHHTDFEKPQYRGHCYAHLDAVWSPVSQGKIDSGCRNDLPLDATGRHRRPNCSAVIAPRPRPGPAPAPPAHCSTHFDCSGANGNCTTGGACICKAGWAGALCNELQFAPSTSRVAYSSPDWTWGGSPILDGAGTYHLFSSRISNNCGILHYCINSEVIHLTSANATGPYVLREVALGPRAGSWDNGAVHGISVHRLPNRSYALFYMVRRPLRPFRRPF
jgi:hypothetical protein